MTIVEDNGPVTVEALVAFESKFRRLPDDYRDFLALHNGAELSGTASLRGPGEWPVDYFEGIQNAEQWHEHYPKLSIPIASDGMGNTYVMSLAKESHGRIYFLDHEIAAESKKPVSRLPLVASTFTEFLERIQDFDPDDREEEALFHELARRRRVADEQLQAILHPRKPWWKFW